MNSGEVPGDRRAVVELIGVARTFAGTPPVEALKPTDLVIHEGDYLAIIGPSGSGKSTLLHLLGLLDQPTAGTYRLDGVDIDDLSERERAGMRSSRIGFVFQSFHLLSHRTTVENVMLAETYRPGSRADRRARAVDALERVGLGHRLDTYPTTLSGGERQRVAVARAIVDRPSLLLADEPTGNLDSVTSAAMLDLFDELHANGLTLAVITHDDEVSARAERKVGIRDGVVSAVESPASPGSHRVAELAESGRTERSRIPRSHLSVRDLLNEATIALTARPARTILTAMGTVLGVAALVATLGLAKTAGNQIVSRFDELEATSVVVRPPRDRGFNPNAEQQQTSAIPFDAGDRLERLNGVVAAGTMSDVDSGALARSIPLIDPLGQSEFNVPVIAVSPGLFDAVRAQLAAGRFFDEGHDERGDNVAVLGPGAARRLNVNQVDTSPAVFVGETTLAVIGVIEDVARKPELLNAIIVPNGFARSRYGLEAPAEVHIEVEIGAAELIGSQAAIALSPNEPDALRVSLPPSPRRIRSSVESDVNALFLVLGAVSLLVGAIGIANVTLVSVLERTGEIGLRRALGATRRHVAAQFLFESAALGAFAGLLGASLGILTVVAVSANRQWTPVLDAWLPFVAPVLGAAIGLIAGTYPAWKASATEPIAALRA